MDNGDNGINGIAFTVADADFYVPPADAGRGRRLEPSIELPGWQRTDSGVWTVRVPPAHEMPSQGWKVHVAARRERTQMVLDRVAEVCHRHGVAFKHVSTDWLFLWQHHKHGDRVQSGKFCTAYPADADRAEALMRALAEALQGEVGPTVLTDRPFPGSRVVSYRYGGFVGRSRLLADGTHRPQVLDGSGTPVDDRRTARFTLPDGVRDPFAGDVTAAQADPEPSFGGYRFSRLVRATNSGGSYLATAAAGRPVFVKQARPHNGYQWDGSTAVERLRHEHRVLLQLQDACPGVAPEPVELFTAGEHDYLVTELVPGRTLWSWAAEHNPLALTDIRPAAQAGYLARCRRLLDRLQEQLDRLHAAGYVFVDLNPGNVLVDEHDRPRLVDFEVAGRVADPVRGHGAAGYVPPAALEPGGRPVHPLHFDDYGFAALAQMLLQPLHAVLDRNPAALAHLRADLPGVTDDLWRRATRFRPPTTDGPLPSPEQVAEDPQRWLDWLRDRTARGLLEQLEPGADRAVRTVPEGLARNPFGLAYGTAGVVHALARCGLPVDVRMVDRLSRAIDGRRDDLPPGLMAGTAGIALVLADQGRPDLARGALLRAARHPLLADPDLSDGRAGVALALLHVDRHVRDEALVDLAAELLDPLLDVRRLQAPDRRSGWRHGGAGLALALDRLARRTGRSHYTDVARAALHGELDRAHPVGNGGLLFRVSDHDARVEPYVACGSAGFAMVTARVLAGGDPDPVLEDALERSVVSVAGGGLALLPSLFEGLAGLALVLAELDVLRPELDVREGAWRLARGLFKHAVPGPGGSLRFLGGTGARISDDLAYGSAGVLLLLDHLPRRRTGALLTLDEPVPALAAAAARHP
jgi:tRNA A-37 threonylcarbamoyl transferase component Bud32